MALQSTDPSCWVKDHGDILFSYCVVRIGNKEIAEDLVQETFLSALKSLHTFKSQSSLQTWLVAILKNKITDYYRKKDVLKDTQSYLSNTESEFSDHFFNPSDGHWVREVMPGDWSTSADQDVNSKEFDQILQACIHKMPGKLIPVFISKFFDEEDSETICKDHGLSSSNYWVIIHRAKLLVRSCLEKNWFLTGNVK